MAGNNRFVELDGVRGIAVMMVVVYHYTTLFDRFFKGHDVFPFTFEAGSMGVQLFFMVSGFVIFMTARRRRTPSGFALARAIRLYPTYWACLTLTIVIVYASCVEPLYRTTRELALNYTMLQSFIGVRSIDGAYWSLARELIFYGIIALALLVLRGELTQKFVTSLVMVWSAIGVALCAVDVAVGSNATHLAVTATAGQYAALFGIGMVMFEVREGTRTWNAPTAALLAYLAVAASLCEALLGEPVRVPVILFLIGAFVLIAARPSVPFLRARPLVWLGAISYPLYLLHQNVGYVVLHHTVDTVGRYPARVLALLVSVLLAWLVHELVEVRVSRRIGRAIDARRAQRVTVNA